MEEFQVDLDAGEVTERLETCDQLVGIGREHPWYDAIERTDGHHQLGGGHPETILDTLEVHPDVAASWGVGDDPVADPFYFRARTHEVLHECVVNLAHFAGDGDQRW